MSNETAPFGAVWDGAGVQFSIFSAHAEKVVLCLFDHPDDQFESKQILLEDSQSGVWSVYVPDIQPGQLYGYRVHGPYAPEEGMRFNHCKVLMDPYAKAVGREARWSDALFGYDRAGGEEDDLYMDRVDSAHCCPLAAVVEPLDLRNSPPPPNLPMQHLVIYELQVRGITQLHPDVPPELRGTYAGLASQPIISHLLKLGVTAVELLPVHYHVDEWHLLGRGLVNYWGYSTLGYFAPDPRFSSKADPLAVIREFREMVDCFHAAGIEVLIDVVYNHTCEGNQFGPTLSFRGIDNPTYYRLNEASPRYYSDYTGCGNTVNAAHPQVRRMVLDSMRYWVTELGVDGFRFDLAPALARDQRDMNPDSVFFREVAEDPILSKKKMIAEPWDLGEGGYQLGNFPSPWSEWNGRFRDSVRSFWIGAPQSAAPFATALSGSSDLFSHNGRGPGAGINFVTCHDGFTLRDLVSYNQKHNEINGEQNRDGRDDNRSWNCGVEGETRDPAIQALRLKQRKNILTSLFLSAGVPMLLAGDEMGRTQYGNNNAYCQDNELSWLMWKLLPEQQALCEFVRWLISFRNSHPTFTRSVFFSGEVDPTTGEKDISWWLPDGREIADNDWSNGSLRQLGVVFGSGRVDIPHAAMQHDTVVFWCNATAEQVTFVLPKPLRSRIWMLVLDSHDPSTPGAPRALGASRFKLAPHSVVLLRACEFD